MSDTVFLLLLIGTNVALIGLVVSNFIQHKINENVQKQIKVQNSVIIGLFDREKR